MIKFSYYRGLKPSLEKEKVASLTITKLRQHLSLPQNIEIQFVDLGPGNYAEAIVNTNTTNVVRLNVNLDAKDLIIPLTHEMIHIEQLYTKRLSSTRTGKIIWEGKKYSVREDMPYDEYQMLPWEQDVQARIGTLLKSILKNAD